MLPAAYGVLLQRGSGRSQDSLLQRVHDPDPLQVKVSVGLNDHVRRDLLALLERPEFGVGHRKLHGHRGHVPGDIPVVHDERMVLGVDRHDLSFQVVDGGAGRGRRLLLWGATLQKEHDGDRSRENQGPAAQTGADGPKAARLAAVREVPPRRVARQCE